MSVAAERGLAMLDAEDGELQAAEEALDALIGRLDAGLRAAPEDKGAAYEFARCLLDRASVRAWAVRPREALADLDRADALAERMKAVNRHSLRVNLLESRIRLIGAPRSPVHDAAGAHAALALLRAELEGHRDGWIADAAELRMAWHERDWARVAAIAPALVEVLEAHNHPRGVHAVLGQLARARLNLGNAALALEPAERAHAFFDAEGPEDLAAGTGLALARARGRVADWALAEAALARAERLTRAQRSLFDQQRYLTEKLELFEDALRLALRLAEAEPAMLATAWQVAERSKSFSLRQAMTHGGWLEAIDPGIGAELAALDRRLDALEAQGGEREAAVALRAELAAQRQGLLDAAMRRHPRIADAQAPAPLDLAARLKALPAGLGLVSWYWIEEAGGWRLLIFHAGADRRPRLASTRWSAGELAALGAARHAAARARPFQVRQMLPAALGGRLLPPVVLDALAGCSSLLVTPHRDLRQLPLHAARLTGPEGEGWLIERFALQVLPTLALPFPAPRPRRERREVLLLGCAQDGYGSPPLHDVPGELDDLAVVWSAAGQRAACHALAPDEGLEAHAPLAEWPRYDLIHLACHGRFVPERPLDAALYLGTEALRASELFGLKLGAEVVSLSACDLGQHGETVDGLALVGDEWLGLALPLFQAGARSLLASLWQADSATARAFMHDFHAALARGLAPALAHREACLAQLRRPYGLWANWQLAGFPG